MNFKNAQIGMRVKDPKHFPRLQNMLIRKVIDLDGERWITAEDQHYPNFVFTYFTKEPSKDWSIRQLEVI